MARAYRMWTLEQRRAAVEEMSVRKHTAVAKELGIATRLLYRWREEMRRLERSAKRDVSREQALEQENRQLKQALGAKALEADFFKGVLRRIEAQRQPASGSGATASTRRSE
jgi:Transposase